MNMTQQLQQARAQCISRRWFLRDCGVGLAGIAAGSLLAAENPLAPRQPHFPAKAKQRRVGIDERGSIAFQQFGRRKLSVVLGEFRLVVEQFQMAGSAGLKNIDDPLGLRREVRLSWGQ